MWPKTGPIETYAIFYIAGCIVHFVICASLGRRLRVQRRVWVSVAVCYGLGMSVGAKLLHDVMSGHFQLTKLFSIEHYLQGGLWGGPLTFIVLAVPLVLLLARNKRTALDLMAFSLPIPMIFAKLACFCQGCCYGRACSLPWAVTFPEGGEPPAGTPLHPTQLYEILVLLCVILMFNLLDKRYWQGMMLLWFFSVYGLGRAFAGLFRGDLKFTYVYGLLSLSQIICVAGAVVSFLLLCVYASRKSSAQPYTRL